MRFLTPFASRTQAGLRRLWTSPWAISSLWEMQSHGNSVLLSAMVWGNVQSPFCKRERFFSLWVSDLKKQFPKWEVSNQLSLLVLVYVFLKLFAPFLVLWVWQAASKWAPLPSLLGGFCHHQPLLRVLEFPALKDNAASYPERANTLPFMLISLNPEEGRDSICWRWHRCGLTGCTSSVNYPNNCSAFGGNWSFITSSFCESS